MTFNPNPASLSDKPEVSLFFKRASCERLLENQPDVATNFIMRKEFLSQRMQPRWIK